MRHHNYIYFEPLISYFVGDLKVEKVQKALRCQFQHISLWLRRICYIPFRCQKFALYENNNKKSPYLSLKACQILIFQSFRGKRLKWLSPTILKRKNGINNRQFRVYNRQFEVYNRQIEVYNRQFKVYNRQFEVSIIHFKLYNRQFKVYNRQFEVSIIHFKLYNRRFEVYNRKFKVYNRLFEVSIVHFKLYNRQFEVYNRQFGVSKLKNKKIFMWH